MTRASRSAVRGGQDLPAVPARLGRQRATPQALATSAPRVGSPTGLPAEQPGQGAGLDRAALPGPARHPGQLRAGRGGQRRGYRGQRARAPRPAARLPGSPRRRRPAPAGGRAWVCHCTAVPLAAAA